MMSITFDFKGLIMVQICKGRLQLNGKQRSYVLRIEKENGEIEKLTLDDKLICWEGFRKVSGKLMRGVPKRSLEDCSKYCHHEGCQFI